MLFSPHPAPRHHPRRGQAIVLLLSVLLVFLALAFWIFDIYKPLLAKLRVQDGGDAAVLSAARWQAAGLNLIGELNLIQAYMLADDENNLEAAANLHTLSQHVYITTPFLGLYAAHLTAERNGLDSLPGTGEILRTRSRHIEFDNMYPGADDDVRALVDYIARTDLCAFPLSSIDEEAEPASMLTNRAFYDAILGRDWCWFWFNAYGFLKSYSSRSDFGPPPRFKGILPFNLHVGSSVAKLNALTDTVPFSDALTELGHPPLPPPPPPESPSPAHWERRTPVHWAVYDPKYWGSWEAMHHGELPIRGTLKAKFDYDGADAALSVRRGNANWIAAAKPFGSVADSNPTEFSLLLGGFNDVRLIPVDAADAGLTGYDPVWINHLHTHLRGYLATGIGVEGCRFCSALQRWDNPAFRQTAMLWLEEYGHTCRRPHPGGNGDGGGSSYAH